MQHHIAGRVAEAESIYQQILHADPNQPVALNLLGMVAYQVGKIDIAVELITKAINTKPDYAEAHFNLGNALQALERSDEAIVHFQKVIDIKPDYADAHNNLGSALQALQRLDEAVVHYQKAIDNKPDLATAHSNLGNALQELERHDEAVVHFLKAIYIKPDLATAHNNLGNALQALERFDEAVVHYQKAIDIIPDYAEAHFNLGIALKALKRLGEAVFHFLKAIDIKPDYATAHGNLDNVFHNLGKIDKGVPTSETIDHPSQLTVDAAFSRAKDHFINGCYAEADRICTAIILTVPEHIDTLKLLGDIAQEIGRHDLAVKLFQRAIKFDDSIPVLYFNLGISFDQLGHEEVAVRVMQIAMEKDPNNKKAADYLKGRKSAYRTVKVGEKNINFFDDDLFTVSFPRSGSTWLRCLLSAIFNSEVDITKFSDVDYYVPTLNIDDNISLLRPLSPRWMHSFEMYNPGYKRVLYFYRDVRYVIPSYYKHYQKQHDYDCGFDKFLDSFIKGETQLGMNTGCWKTHVESWLDRPQEEGVITFKYETLRENPEETIGTFLTQIGHPKDRKLISKAVEQFKLKNLKKMEQNDQATPYLRKKRKIPFFGGGQSMHWREMLEARHIERIKNHYNELLVRLGYEKDDQW